MKIKNSELWIALVLIVIISFVYFLFAVRWEVPAPSGWIGHGLGVIGFVLMLMTEILYSVRKRYQFARWGKLQHWLSFHIVTGIVGPFMVLLHTSWKFNGLAGLLTIMTVIIVASGFIGRYIYTALPRSPEGILLESNQVQQLIDSKGSEIDSWFQHNPESQSFITHPVSGSDADQKPAKMDSRTWRDLAQSSTDPGAARELKTLFRQQSRLQRQLRDLERSRRLLAIWHTLHVPIGIAVFSLAFVHVLAALYYATLVK